MSRCSLGIQDVSYAMNFVMAAEALGLGTCFFGGAPMIEPVLKDVWSARTSVSCGRHGCRLPG